MATGREVAAFNTFCGERRTELLFLARYLEEKRLIADASPLRAAAGQFAKPVGELHWSYRVTNLKFDFPLPRGTVPAVAGGLTVELNITAKGQVPCPAHDPFTALAVDIELRASGPAGATQLSTWHLDRHITGPGAVPPEFHPLYHFQYGGRGMARVHDALGHTLLLEAPRLIHPPMDAVLAVDFVLGNYNGAGRAAAIKDATYRRHIREAQRRLWRPLDSMLASAWEVATDRAIIAMLSPAIIHRD